MTDGAPIPLPEQAGARYAGCVRTATNAIDRGDSRLATLAQERLGVADHQFNACTSSERWDLALLRHTAHRWVQAANRAKVDW